MTQKGIVLVSGMTPSTKDIVVATVKHLGGFKLIDKHERKLKPTHVICGDHRTLAVLQAILKGSWLLTPQWAMISLEKGKWAPEKDFRATEWYPSIKSRQPGQPLTLWDANEAVYIGSIAADQSQNVAELVRMAGGKIVTLPRAADLCLGTVDNKELQPEEGKKQGPTVVREKWLYGAHYYFFSFFSSFLCP